MTTIIMKKEYPRFFARRKHENGLSENKLASVQIITIFVGIQNNKYLKV